MSRIKAAPVVLIAAPFISWKRVRLSTGTDRRVLVVAPQWVGDAIMSLPLVAQLAAEYAQVDVLATPAVAAVYQCCANVHQLHVEAFRHGQLQWALRKTVAQKLKGRYTTAVVLPNSIKSALVPWLAGIPRRVGVLGEHRYLLVNDRRAPARTATVSANPAPAPAAIAPANPVPAPASSSDAKAPVPPSGRPSMLVHYLMLADHPPALTQIDAWQRHRPRLRIPPAQAAALANTPSAEVIAGGLLALCPGAEYGPAKQWPAAQFAQVAVAWLAEHPAHQVAIIGSPKDQAIAAEIVGAVTQRFAQVVHGAAAVSAPLAQRLINLCGKTQLIQAFAWIAAARCVVSNDSGLMHAAAAFDVPVAAIFGSTDPVHTPPHSPNAQIFSLQLSCSPCFKRVCPLSTTACLRDLSAAPVIEFLKNRAGG